jgi:hypothetical protein
MFATRRLLASAWRRRFSSNSAVSANDSRLAQQVAARAALPPKFAIVDSTLREGEQFMVCRHLLFFLVLFLFIYSLRRPNSRKRIVSTLPRCSTDSASNTSNW